MAVFLVLKDITIKVGRPGSPGCEWYSKGQGFVGTVLENDGTFLTVKVADHNEPLTLPSDALLPILNPQALVRPPNTFCGRCKQRHPEEAVFVLPGGPMVCNKCYAKQGGPFQRFEYDPELKRWVQTAPLLEATV